MNLSPHPYSLRQLQYVVAVAESLSFRKAAERCHVSQPSLSAQVAQLEAGIGVRLFERNRSRVLVTSAGAEVIERARMVLQRADDLEESAVRAGDPFSGNLRVGIIPTVSPYLLPSAAPALRAAYPRLTVSWVEERTESLLGKLESGTLDAVLVAQEAALGDVEREFVARDPFVLAAPGGHPLARTSAPARASELRDQNVLLLDDGHCFRDQALAFCSRAKARELEFRATSLSTLAQMVAGGAGVTLLPRLAVAVEAGGAGLKVRDFVQPAPYRTIVLAWRRHSPLAAPLRDIAGTIRDVYDLREAVALKASGMRRRR